MPVYDEDGKVIEGGMTKEEVEKEVETKLEEVKSSTDEKVEEVKKEYDEKIIDLDDQIKEKDELLLKADDKNINFKKLREEKESLEKEKKELKEKAEGIKSDVLKEITDEKIDEEIEKRAGGDEEKAKLIKFHYDNFKTLPKDAKERKEYLDNACRLAGVPVPGEKEGVPGGTAAFGGGAHMPQPQMPGGGKMSEETKDMAKENMGVTDEDIKRVEEPK